MTPIHDEVSFDRHLAFLRRPGSALVLLIFQRMEGRCGVWKRLTSSSGFNRSEPFCFYLLIVAGTLFPWSPLLPEASVAA